MRTELEIMLGKGKAGFSDMSVHIYEITRPPIHEEKYLASCCHRNYK